MSEGIFETVGAGIDHVIAKTPAFMYNGIFDESGFDISNGLQIAGVLYALLFYPKVGKTEAIATGAFPFLIGMIGNNVM